MNLSTDKRSKYILGSFFILLGLVVNIPVFEFLLVADRNLTSPSVTYGIIAGQIISVLIGVYILRGNYRFQLPSPGELAVLLGSILAFFLLGEVGTRVWLNNMATPEKQQKYYLFSELEDSARYSKHHYLTYFPTPNYSNGNTRHNSNGFRGKEISPTKAPGVFRILTIGGSTTYTSEVPDDNATYPARLEQYLQRNYGYHQLEVINAGVVGYTSWESLVNLAFRGIDFAPDLVIIYHNTNDVHSRLIDPGTYKSDNSGRRQAWTAPNNPAIEYSAFLRIITRSLGLTRQVKLDDFINAPTFKGNTRKSYAGYTVDPKQLLQENPPEYLQRNLESMIAIARIHGADVLLSTFATTSKIPNDYTLYPHYQLAHDTHNKLIKVVAKKHQVALLDFASQMPEDKKYWADGIHVNEAGAALKGQIFARFIHENGLINIDSSRTKDNFSDE